MDKSRSSGDNGNRRDRDRDDNYRNNDRSRRRSNYRNDERPGSQRQISGTPRSRNQENIPHDYEDAYYHTNDFPVEHDRRDPYRVEHDRRDRYHVEPNSRGRVRLEPDQSERITVEHDRVVPECRAPLEEYNRNNTDHNTKVHKSDPKRPPNSPPFAAGPDKRIKTDDRPGPSTDPDSTPVHTGDKSGPSKDESKNRSDRYEIVKTKPSTCTNKHGTSGQKINLRANFFKLSKRPRFELVQYRVDFNPECGLPTRKYLMYTQREFLNGYLYDTQNSIYLTHRLSENDDVVYCKDCNDNDGNNFQVTFKFASTISMDTRESLQVLNLILRRTMDGLQLKLVGRNLFDPLAKANLDDLQLQVWPGYITSIRQHENSVLLCTEITSKIMRRETVYDIWQQCQEDRNAFFLNVLGMVVLTDYNNTTYRVHDFDFDSTPSRTFVHKELGTISLAQYYKQRYQITIRNPLQPLLVSRSKKKQLPDGSPEQIILIPELCRPTGLSEKQRSNFHLMKGISQHTRMDPGARMRKLNEFNGRLSNTQASVEMLKTWNFELDRKLVEIPGRVFKNENIFYGNGVKEPTSVRSSDWPFRNKAMFLTYPLKRWAILTPHKMSYQVNSFVQNLIKISREMNFHVARPQILKFNGDRNDAYVLAFNDALRSDPQLIMAFVPTNNADRYACIKKLGCVTHGIPTQVIAQRTINNDKGIMSIATKVLIQMNCKLGGVPWLVHIPMEGLMTVGIDISRDSKDKQFIWAALVATMCLKNVTKESFYSTVTRHQNSGEFHTQLALNMVKAIKCYQEMNGDALPRKICVYRDGVGEGQTALVFENEVKSLEKRLNDIYGQQFHELKLSFIVVSKRINARIFARNENPSPGTIVDDIITLPERYDFYLVSQSVRQGTVSPTSYNVLYDTMGLSADQLQQLTYKQTHLYYNWCGTVRVPAVCQYAHKLTFLVAQCLHDIPMSALDKKLYFL